MSTTIGTVRDRVRTKLRDRNASDAMMNSFEINNMIRTELPPLLQEIGLGPTWETSILTLTPNTYEYTIPVASGKAMLQQVQAFRLHSRNWPLARITNEELEAMRRGPSYSMGPPQAIVMWEDDSQQLRVRLWPVPSEADTVDWLRSWVPAYTGIDSDSIPLSEGAVGVLIDRVVRACLLLLPDDVIANRQINRNYVSLLSSDIERGVKLERIRINSLKRTGRLTRSQA